MNGAGFCCVIVCLLLNVGEPLPCCDRDESKRNGSASDEDSASQWYEPISGLKVNYDNKELIVRYTPFAKKENAVQGRDGGGGGGNKGGYGGGGNKGGYGGGGYGGGYGGGGKKKKDGIIKKIGKYMALIPIGMQLLQIPSMIASVKANLIKSIIIAKVAVFLLLLRAVLTSNQKEKVVIVKVPPKEFHEHFYHPFEDPEDSKPGWLGKGPDWME